MSKGPRISIDKALPIANRFLKLLQPHVEKAEIAGSIRRLNTMVGDIEIVCVESPFNALENTFHSKYPGMVVNGPRLKRFKYPKMNLQIELYITSAHDYGRILAIRTGSSAYSHHKLAVTWNRLGWCGTSDGLRRKKECEKKSSKWVLKPEITEPILPPVFNTEYDFYDFLKIPWIPPNQRNWTSNNNEHNY